MSADPSTRRVHLWSGLVVLLVFLAGGAAGAGLMAALHPGPRFPPPPRGGWLPPYLNELQLTEDQKTRARAIFDKHHSAVEATVRETFPRIRAAQEQMERELRAVLTEGQAKKLEEIQARRPPGGPGSDPHGPPFGPPPDGTPPPSDQPNAQNTAPTEKSNH